MTILVYWSQTGVTRRLCEPHHGIPTTAYTGGDYIIAIPSYGSPRTGNYVPTPIKRFIHHHPEHLVGIIGVGNRVFGPDFCKGAKRAAHHYQVPLIATVDMVPTPEETQAITNALKDNNDS